ncbi:hypothetical protein ANN_21982 [Periplaneta americana]|uniref:Uncharacterized protein n=1 Tax=Periplaneta americana TaxID=6978 RepID=A0ABQ8S6W4_PERAM|nr:hypothetical protein ANN_21982 [Periplaneta americana]
MGESRNAYRVLVGRPEGKRPLGRPRRRWEDNIKMDLRDVGYGDRDWINLAQDRDRWRAYVRAAMNLRIRDQLATAGYRTENSDSENIQYSKFSAVTSCEVERPRRSWEDNIKMDLREVGYDDRDWINLAQGRDHWRAYVRAAMNLPFLKANLARSGEYGGCGRQVFCVLRGLRSPRAADVLGYCHDEEPNSVLVTNLVFFVELHHEDVEKL